MSELERWEARFAGPGYHFGTEPNAFLKSKAGLLKPGQKALSIADGEGRNGVFLAEQGLDVLAMDFSPTALAKSQALARQREHLLHHVREVAVHRAAVARLQVNLVAVAEHDRPEAVPLGLEAPAVAVRQLLRRARQLGLDRRFERKGHS